MNQSPLQLPADFFKKYWQRKPCLLKQATHWRPEITPDEIAGIACDPQSRSRLIFEHPTRQGPDRWQLEHGPFDESRLAQLPDSHWTLLVQELDQWDEQVAALLNVPVIPQWRVEDIMVSVAVDQGSVGPHFDYYDVFLIQGSGQRIWHLGNRASEHVLIPHELLLLQDMHIDQTCVCEPGDVLYIPPGIAHWGIAQGECMTFSIGFRAPSVAEFLQGMADHVAPHMQDTLRYQDSENTLAYHKTHGRSHELAASSLAQFRELMHHVSDAHIASWLGCHVTEESAPADDETDDNEFEQAWQAGLFILDGSKRFWFWQPEHFSLFNKGERCEIRCNLPHEHVANLLEPLCQGDEFQRHRLSQDDQQLIKPLLQWLWSQGSCDHHN